MSNTPKTDALIINILGVEFPSRELINLARKMEQDLATRPQAKLYARTGRPRISVEIQRQIAQTPLSVKASHLAKSLKIASSTVARYRKEVK